MSKTDIIGIIIAIFTSGLATKLVFALGSLIKAVSKNKNLLSAVAWSEQAVTYAEHIADTPLNKKNAAKQYLKDTLLKNGLSTKFSEEQIDTLIEVAVAALHDYHPKIK